MRHNRRLKDMNGHSEPKGQPNPVEREATAEPQGRNHYGRTWPEHEEYLRGLLADLSEADQLREIAHQKSLFTLYAEPIPETQERRELFERVYWNLPADRRKRFYETARNDMT